MIDERARYRCAIAVLRQSEEGPGALAETLDQTGFSQQLEMARNTRLRLAKDVGQVRHGQLGLGDQRKNPETRFFARGLEGGIEHVEAEPVAGAHGAPSKPLWALSHYIKISL